MAVAQAYISGVKDILMCAICLEDVKEPRMLVCHHSFCTSCLNSMERTGFLQKLQCPTCRKYTNIPRAVESCLPMDYKLNELSELHSRAAEIEESQPVESEVLSSESEEGLSIVSKEGLSAESEESLMVEPIVCAACAGNANDNGKVYYYSYCNNCHDYLCDICTDVHKDIPVFKNHDVICLAGKHIAPRQICLDHSMKYKDYHCEECKQLVCSVCVVNSHREHTVRPFEQHDKICRDKIDKQGLELYKVFHVPLYFKVSLFPKNITQPLITCLDDTTDRITKKINDAANSITTHIEQQRYELTNLVKKQHSTVQKILSANILKRHCEYLRWSKEPDMLVNEYQQLSEDIDTILAGNGDEEISELTVDSQLYDDFSAEALKRPIGTLSSNTLKEYISKNELANSNSSHR